MDRGQSKQEIHVEGFSDVHYELHCFSTIPFIALAFAYVIYRRCSPATAKQGADAASDQATGKT